MPIANFDSEQVLERAFVLWEIAISDGIDDIAPFLEWLLQKELISQEQHDKEDGIDELIIKYEEEYARYILDGDIPDYYIERAAESFTDEASDHGYSARFTD